MGKNSTIKKITAVILCLIMLFSMYIVSGVNASAEDIELDYYATVDDTFGPKTSGAGNGFVLENLASGGIKIGMSRFGASFPYVYARNFGSFPGDGFMLEFSDYFNESPHKYYGYCTFLLTLSPDGTDSKYKKFNKGMAGILFDAASGEVSLVESLIDVALTKDDPNDKGDPNRDDQFVVKQKILQTDYFKAGSLLDKTFKIYFTPVGDDINLTLDIGGKIVSGIIDRDILNSIPKHPTNSTYIAFSSIDFYHYEWNQWSVKFHGHRILDGSVQENSDGSNTYENGVITMDDDNIRWLGRWTNDAGAAKGYFQSGFEVKINGTLLKVKTDKPIIASVDGGDWKSYPAGTPTVFSSDKSGEHKIKIMSPYENATPKISGLYSNVFAKILPADENKTIIFIGDSATAGYSTKDKKFEKSIANNYALQVAKRLDYAVSIVANANATILAGESTDKLGMPARYFKLGELNSDAQNKNYEIYDEPDCIVVALGSYGTNGGDKVQSAYQSFIEKLRENYPDSAIVCMTPVSNRNIDTIKKSVGNLQKEGDQNVFFINASKWGAELCSDGINPTQNGHKTMASKLTSALKSIMSGKATINVTSAKASANNTQSTKPTSSKDNNTSVDVDVDVNVDVEYDKDNTEAKDGGIMDYLWLFITVCAIVVIGLLVVIFLPNIKKRFAKK